MNAPHQQHSDAEHEAHPERFRRVRTAIRRIVEMGKLPTGNPGTCTRPPVRVQLSADFLWACHSCGTRNGIHRDECRECGISIHESFRREE